MLQIHAKVIFQCYLPKEITNELKYFKINILKFLILIWKFYHLNQHSA